MSNLAMTLVMKKEDLEDFKERAIRRTFNLVIPLAQ